MSAPALDGSASENPDVVLIGAGIMGATLGTSTRSPTSTTTVTAAEASPWRISTRG
jgi:hypothetical protein